MSDESYWVVTASADHAARGRAEGIVQANHGKDGPVRRMKPGDGVVIYSPRTTFPDGPPLQAFTLIGRIAGDEPWQHAVAGNLMWRRRVQWKRRPHRADPPDAGRVGDYARPDVMGHGLPLWADEAKPGRFRPDCPGDGGVKRRRGRQGSVRLWPLDGMP